MSQSSLNEHMEILLRLGHHMSTVMEDNGQQRNRLREIWAASADCRSP